MSRAVMFSIQPRHCNNILLEIDLIKDCKFMSKKTIEVRKSAPSIPIPFTGYIYMTATKERCRYWEYITAYTNSKGEILDGSQKVIGEFICDMIDTYPYDTSDGVDIDDDTLLETCLSREEINIYANGKTLYGIHITDLKIYDKPKELSDFIVECKPGYVKCHKCEDSHIDFCSVQDGKFLKILTTPPQSWRYVAGLWREQ